MKKDHAFMTGVESESESQYSASRLATPSMTSTQVTTTKKVQMSEMKPPQLSEDSPLITGKETEAQFEQRLEDQFWNDKKALRDGYSETQKIQSDMQCL